MGINYTKYIKQVRNYYFAHRKLPTYKEMADLFEFSSKGSVSYFVNKWIKVGLLEKKRGSLVPTDLFLEFPHLGIIPAGSPVSSVPMDDTIGLPFFSIPHPEHTYVLSVSGDSMINEGIRSGDLVIVDKAIEPKAGDVVAACIDGEWTLKYFKRRDGKVYLEAANPDYPSLYPSQNLEIGGVVIQVIRDYQKRS
ncbi:MAG: hypothetical protein NUV52_04250 [Candidatus Roizmanbacteria bacterium]|nr:hypothetical protein [Candidatus Roizmanbacteria bacterium]